MSREEQLRIQALGAALSRRDWHATEQAYNAIRDEFDRRPSRTTASTDEPAATGPVSDEDLALKIGSYLAISNLEADDISYIRELLTATPLSSGNADAVRERDLIAQALLDRFIERGSVRFGGSTFRKGTDVKTLVRSYRDDFYDDADAVIAALSSAPVAGEWQGVAKDALERIVDHDPDRPGLRYDTERQLIDSMVATARDALSRNDRGEVQS